MTQESFVKMFAKLCVAFSKEYSPEQCDIYYDELKHLTDREVSLSMRKCVQSCRFFPTVADILDSIPKSIHEPKKLEAGNGVPMPDHVKEMIKTIGRKI